MPGEGEEHEIFTAGAAVIQPEHVNSRVVFSAIS
jgi:hypothetical protein